MRRFLYVLVLVMLIIVFSACGGGGTAIIPGGGNVLVQHGDYSITTGEQEMLDRHDLARNAAGVANLTVDTDLTRIAQDHANHMADTGNLNHVDSSGRNVWDRADAIGIVYGTIGENIGYNVSAQTLFDGWMASSGHRGNIESGAFTRIGIGRALSGSYQYWCVVFSN